MVSGALKLYRYGAKAVKIGDRISVQNANGTIKEVRGEFSSCVVLMDDGSIWFSPREFKPEILTAFPQIEESIPYYLPIIDEAEVEKGKAGNDPEMVPAEIPESFLLHLRQHQDRVDIRMGFPPKAEAGVRDLFDQLKILMPENIRAFDIGSRGGNEEKGKRGLGLEVTFPALSDASVIPLRYRVLADGQIRICNTRFGLGLLVLGFKVTNYTKVKTVSLP